ncbi:MAG: nucleotidyltransferase domain-containing protein [Cyclobacteriaceae bacterium]|nr:nucleotidyltransferase domain-containing protein [Cyclobacteriaceae bacterium]
MTIDQIKNITTPILQRHKVTKAAIFGSMADGTFTGNSDVDILVELDDSYSLLDFIGIKLDLEAALHRSVDLVEYRAVKPALKKYILENPIPIYG